MAEKPDIRVLVDVDGGASIDGKSGQLIANTLEKLAKNISAQKRPHITFDVDFENTTKKVYKQLNEIVKSIKVEPIDLQIRTNQSSMGTFAEDEYRKLIDETRGKKARANLIAHIQEKQGLADVAVQIQKNIELTNKQTQADKKRTEQLQELIENIKFANSPEASTKHNAIENSFDKLGANDNTIDAYKKLQELKTLASATITELHSKYGTTDSQSLAEKLVDSKDIKDLTDFNGILTQYKTSLEQIDKLSRVDSPTFVKDVRNATNDKNLEEFILTLTRFEQMNDKFKSNSGLASQFESIKAAAAGFKATGNFSDVDVKNLRTQLSKLNIEMTNLGLNGQSAFGKLRAQMEKLGVYFSASAIMMGTLRQIKQTISTVIELDKVVTDLSVATGKNREETKALLDTYSELGKELGATTGAVAKAADDWLRQGKSIATTNKLIKDSLMLSKLGKIDSSEATTALTTMSKAYKVADDNMTSLVDKLTAVDAVSATTAGGIAKSFQETAVSANLAGISIDRMAGYIATVSEISGDAPESVGTFFRTFLSRMSSIKEGRMIDPDTGEDLSTVETVLKNIGIQLRNDQGQFRNFQDVLDETAAKWKELEATGDKVGQTKIASALGLTRQQEKAKILFEHYDEAIKYAEISANSLGTAEEKFNNAYMTGTEASMDAFTAQYEQMSNVIWDSGLIKGTFDTGAGLLGALTWIIENLDIIPTLATVAAGSLSALSNKGWLKNLSDKRTYALLQSGGNTERADIFSKRLYSNTSKWLVVKTISSVNNNTDGKVLLIA